MTIDNWLQQTTLTFEQADIATARLDTLVLLEDITGRDRSWLLAHPEYELSPTQTTKFKKLLALRVQHVPLAYVRGKAEFYGREFVLTPAVLQPRPESETMIDLLKEITIPASTSEFRQKNTYALPAVIHIADVGAGSGALGITAALELPSSQIELLEIDKKALKVAKTNVEKFTPDICVIESDLLNSSSQPNDILLCNLPYVPDDFQINRAALHEPKIAIFGGPDGLDLYRRLFEQITKLSKRPLFILTESLPPQHTALQTIATTVGYRLLQTNDFIQVFMISANSTASPGN